MPEKILIVDDELAILKAFQRTFGHESYEIFTASSGKEALELLEKEDIDVVISDQQMPEMTGTELLATIAQIYPNTIGIMLTGYPSLNNAMEAINRGEVFRFLTKPWNDIELEIAIREAIVQRKVRQTGREQMVRE